MKRILTTTLATTLFCISAGMAMAEDGRALPVEVTTKVRQAAAFLAEKGPAGLDRIRDPGSEFTWKDSYVFVVDCDADLVLANPAFPERQGGDIKQHAGYDGKPYGRALCETARTPGGGWVEYVWLKPGGDVPLRKISFVMSVDGLPYQVGAGIYDETVTLEELVAIAEMSE